MNFKLLSEICVLMCILSISCYQNLNKFRKRRNDTYNQWLILVSISNFFFNEFKLTYFNGNS